ncbi:MAG TPA: MBL fold metallo-hydrolase [Chromatiaceae bacterium]|nr:MBL fold metallo-hydrolase [Chromatiaceae bacterium]
MPQAPRLTIVFDNYPGLAGCRCLWGFAAWIEFEGRNLLFDTGSNGRILLQNLATLGLAPRALDLLVLSHPHWDHMGGLDSILELNPRLTLAVHEGFSQHLIADLPGLCGELIVLGPEPRCLAPGIYASGVLDSDPPEQALLIYSGGITAVISGCAHPGMARVVEGASAFLGKPLDWAIGGFHLMNAAAPQIEETIQALRAQGVRSVIPTHCTGDLAKAAFRRAYGTRCLEGGPGRQWDLADIPPL